MYLISLSWSLAQNDCVFICIHKKKDADSQDVSWNVSAIMNEIVL